MKPHFQYSGQRAARHASIVSNRSRNVISRSRIFNFTQTSGRYYETGDIDPSRTAGTITWLRRITRVGLYTREQVATRAARRGERGHAARTRWRDMRERLWRV